MDAIEAFRQQAERDRALVLHLRAATERLAQAEAARTEAIASAHRLGLSIREIAAATGLSPSRVHQIVAAANEGASSAQEPQVDEGGETHMNQVRYEAMPVVIPTGSATLDRALGVGGVPRGRIIEIFGPPASGKTTLALHIVAEAQRLGQAVAYIDGTHTLDLAYVRACGVDPDHMPIDRPATTKEALARVVRHTEDNAVAALVLDAVQLLPPDDGEEVARMRAGLIAQALRLLTIAITRTNTAVIFLTPVPTEGDAERREGGQALKFYASVRLALQPAEPVRRGSEIIGLRVKAKVVKNKIAVPFHVAEFDLIYRDRERL
jgi:recombination protein RecA